MTKIQPIRPDEAAARQQATIPDFVIEAFNACITAAYANGMATVYQDDVIAAILRTMQSDDDSANRARILRERWLDVEDLYRAKGWSVSSDKPGYNETYRAHFTFRRRRDRGDG